MMASLRLALLAASMLGLSPVVQAADPPLPIFDAHLHYSHDAWEMVPPQAAIDILKKAGVRRALVSSSNDDGQQRLVALAPDLILPSLRPYRSRADTGTWFRDDATVPYLEQRLAKYRYVAMGEFHLFGDNADLPIPRRMVQLARQHGLWLHAHSDVDAVERLFRQWPQAKILWAHSGFDRPEKVREMLRKHPNLWADLAFRTDHGSGGKLDPAWREAFMEFPDRFLVGTDSYVPERWHFIAEHARWSRQWMAELPPPVAEKIAWRNGEAMFGEMLQGRGAVR